MTATAFFVIGGALFWRRPDRPVPADPDSWPAVGPLLPGAGQEDMLLATSFPRIYLQPENIVMGGLLLTVWLALVLDAAGRWLDHDKRRTGAADRRRPIWPALTAALTLGAAWPWLAGENAGPQAAGATLATAAALLAACIATGRRRPAIGFFAGWSTGVFSASLAALAAAQFALPMQAISALAILPAAAIGIVVQSWIGPSIGYSAALIWAFCGLSITTIGSDPTTALAAILGIATMTAVLIRAAS